MKWKYKDAKNVIKMSEFERTVFGYLNREGTLNVKKDTVEALERKLDIPVIGNVELVMQIVGIRTPPSVWHKVIE